MINHRLGKAKTGAIVFAAWRLLKKTAAAAEKWECDLWVQPRKNLQWLI